MTRYWKVAALVVLVVLACINPESPRGSTGRLALRIVLAGGGGTPLDSAYLLITGTKDTTVKVTPGVMATVNQLPGGPYTVSLEGFIGGSVAYFGQTTATVVNGQTTNATITAFAPLTSTPVALPAYTPNGQFTFVYSRAQTAVSYVVQRDSLKTFATSHDTAVSPGTDTSVVISIPPTGPYYVRVIAVDPFGKRGPPSTPLDSITTLSNCCTVAPLGASIITTGGTQAFTVSGKDPKGTVINNVAATWTALNTNVASVAPTGVATAAGEGQTTIVAAVTGTSATPNALLTVATPNATPVNVWSGQASGSTQFIIGIWGTSASNIWVAVDSAGSLMHYDGTAWTRVATSATQNLVGVWGSSANDVFAVGGAGTILHYNGTAWSAMTSNTTAGLLYRVWGSGPSDVFAVGLGGTIDHYNGTTWTVMNSGTTTKNFYGVWGTAANNVFAVGDSSLILHYDGTAWTPMTTPAAGSFIGVRGTGPSDVYATLGLGVPASISHYNGTSWVTVAGPYAGVSFLFDAYFMSPTEGFTSSNNGSMNMYNGTWNTLATSSQNVLYGIWSTPTAIPIVVGAGGAILQGVRGAPFRAFGDSTQFTAGTYNWSSQLLLGEAISISSKIELTTFGLIAGGANDSVQMALYVDSSGVPTHLVAQTAKAIAGGAGVHEFPSTIQTQLQPGTYWVMARYDYASGNPIYHDATATNTYKFVTDSFSVAGLPNPYPASPTTVTNFDHFNYYVRGYVVP